MSVYQHAATRLRLQATNFVLSGLGSIKVVIPWHHGMVVIHPWLWPLALSLCSGAPAPLKGLGMARGLYACVHDIKELRHQRNSKKHVGLGMCSGSVANRCKLGTARPGSKLAFFDGLVEAKSCRRPCCLFANQMNMGPFPVNVPTIFIFNQEMRIS